VPDPKRGEEIGGLPELATIGASRTTARFEVTWLSCLSAAGKPQGPLPGFAEDAAELKALYRAMVLTRTFDAKAVALQRTGRLGTYASSLGQEAVSVGVAAAMRAEDVLLPSFREHGAQLWRGVTPAEILQYWGGDERGSDYSGPREDFPVCIPVASHAPHAAGVALAFKLRAEPRVAVCILGDGATSKGDFYEALNAAGAWALPMVMVVSNNQWSISVPRAAQTAAETLAQKAIAAGMPGVQCDGNDVIAVRHAAATLIERARTGGGPALLEAVTYRLADHTTADDARRYRDEGEVSRHWKDEPVARLRAYLVGRSDWSKEGEQRLLADCAKAVEQAAADYLAIEPVPPTAMFDSLYAELPAPLRAQRAAVAADES
jgi:pyruvate dehydrogenase E1 component alpha subunit